MTSNNYNPRKKALLSKKVDDLSHKYLTLTQPSPILREIIRIPEQYSLLVDAVARQVSLIKCRSPDLDDAQVSIYDQALVWLTGMGANPMHMGALELYLTEYLGVVPICGVGDGRRVVDRYTRLWGMLRTCRFLFLFCSCCLCWFGISLADSVALFEAPEDQDVAAAGGRPISTYRHASSSSSPRHYYCERRRKRRTLSKHHDRQYRGRERSSSISRSISQKERNRPYEHNTNDHDSKVKRILTIFTNAKDEYERTFTNSDNNNDYYNIDIDNDNDNDNENIAKMASAARFLRDTAENALTYLRSNGFVGHASIPELERVFGVARDKATELSGGKKRRFEDGWEGSGGIVGGLGTWREKKSRRMIDSYRP